MTEVSLPQSDHTAAIQDAIDNLGSYKGIVLLGPGEWNVDETITIPNFVTLRGCGRYSTRIRPIHTGPTIHVNGGSTRVEDLAIVPNGVEPGEGIKVTAGRHHWTIDDVRIEGCGIGIKVTGYCSNWEIRRVYVKTSDIGCRLEFGPRHGLITGCRFAGGDTGVVLEGRGTGGPNDAVNDIQITHCNLDGCTDGVETIASVMNAVYMCSLHSSRLENLTTGMKIGANTKSWRYEHLWGSGVPTWISDNGTDTARGWL